MSCSFYTKGSADRLAKDHTLPVPVEKTAPKNLTLFDWMMVYAYINILPQPINQGEVITLCI